MNAIDFPLNPENFLIQSLRYLGEGDEQGLLLYLAQHLEAYESTFADFLAQWFRGFCDRFPAESQLEIAQAVVRLGRIIETVIQPFNNDRYSICLTCYELALSKLTQTTHPLDWANLQRQLGKLHLRHATPSLTSHANLQTTQANNGKVIEKAIVAYNNTLQVFTREDFPQEWAVLQNDLGGVYLKRIQGDQQENLEKAMQCYKKSLEVFDRATYPEDWAGTQNNLGNYYLSRLRGDRATNIETAIDCYTHALEVLTRETHPVGWAGIQMNLGDCYRDRLKGDRLKNLETAIDRYTAALQIYNTPDLDSPRQLTLIKLEKALYDRRTLPTLEVLREAIS